MTDTSTEEVERAEYFIIKRGLYYRPNNRGYTDRPILAGLYTLSDAIATTHPNGEDGPRDGMRYIHESECSDADYVLFKSIAAERDALRAELEEARARVSSVVEEAAQCIEGLTTRSGMSPPLTEVDRQVEAARTMDADIVRSFTTQPEQDALARVRAEADARLARVAALEQQVTDILDDSGQVGSCAYDNPTDTCLGARSAVRSLVAEARREALEAASEKLEHRRQVASDKQAAAFARGDDRTGYLHHAAQGELLDAIAAIRALIGEEE